MPASDHARAVKLAADLCRKYERHPASPETAPRPHLKAYRCPAGQWTIGYGHTGSDVTASTTLASVEDADRILENDLAGILDRIRAVVRVPLADEQLAALASWAFNVRRHWLDGHGGPQATFIKRLNAGDYGAVPAGLLKFCWATVIVNGVNDWHKYKIGPDKDYKPGTYKVQLAGLAARRADEAALWASAPTGVIAQDATIGTDAQPAPPVPATRSPALWSVATSILGAAIVVMQAIVEALPQAQDAAETVAPVLGSRAALVIGGAIVAGAAAASLALVLRARRPDGSSERVSSSAVVGQAS